MHTSALRYERYVLLGAIGFAYIEQQVWNN